MIQLFLFHVYLLIFLWIQPVISDQIPVIGILTQECPKYKKDLAGKKICPPDSSYVPRSYVQFVEASGAEVLIIPITTSNTELENLIKFNKIDGLLIPGGGNNKAEFFRLARHASRIVMDGEIAEFRNFPILGICMGYELILMEAAKQPLEQQLGILEKTRGTKLIGLNLDFTINPRNSRLWQFLPKHIETNLKTKHLTHNAHYYSAFYDTFQKYQQDPTLDVKDFIVTSTSSSPIHQDRILTDFSFPEVGDNQDPFIASLEHKDRHIYGIQFHPEKAAFETQVTEECKAVNSFPGVEYSQYLSNFFVNLCRDYKNSRIMNDSEITKSKAGLVTFEKPANIVKMTNLPAGVTMAKYLCPFVPTPGSGMAKYFRSIYVMGPLSREVDFEQNTL